MDPGAGASTRRRRWVTSTMIAAAATLLVACGSDATSPLSSLERPESAPGATLPAEPAPTEPAPEQPAPEQPAPEQPAPAEPAPEQPPAEPTDNESLATEDWIAVILISLLALGAVIGIVALLNRGSKDPVDNSTQMRLDDITRASRSIHDSSVLSMLRATDDVTLQTGWAVTQQQFVDVQGRISALAAQVTDPTKQRTLQELGAAVAGLQGALGSNVGLRLDPSTADQTDLIEQSRRTVLERNEQLEAATNRAIHLQL